jgi:hypothetical protein
LDKIRSTKVKLSQRSIEFGQYFQRDDQVETYLRMEILKDSLFRLVKGI